LVAQRDYFIWGVGNIEHRNLELVADALQVRDDFDFDFLIKTGERFIHQEQAGRGEKRAGKGDALLLSAGKIRDGAIQQRIDFQDVRDVRQVNSGRRSQGVVPVSEISPQSSTARNPDAGLRSPATTSSSEVFPAPEFPKTPIT
jgi:hypothetical protein